MTDWGSTRANPMGAPGPGSDCRPCANGRKPSAARSLSGHGTARAQRLSSLCRCTEGASAMRVLVVDDHPLFPDGVRSLLYARGVEVVGEAGDGQEALEAALRLKPDVILMDITMPPIDRLEATRLIQV